MRNCNASCGTWRYLQQWALLRLIPYDGKRRGLGRKSLSPHKIYMFVGNVSARKPTNSSPSLILLRSTQRPGTLHAYVIAYYFTTHSHMLALFLWLKRTQTSHLIGGGCSWTSVTSEAGTPCHSAKETLPQGVHSTSNSLEERTNEMPLGDDDLRTSGFNNVWMGPSP